MSVFRVTTLLYTIVPFKQCFNTLLCTSRRSTVCFPASPGVWGGGGVKGNGCVIRSRWGGAVW